MRRDEASRLRKLPGYSSRTRHLHRSRLLMQQGIAHAPGTCTAVGCLCSRVLLTRPAPSPRSAAYAAGYCSRTRHLHRSRPLTQQGIAHAPAAPAPQSAAYAAGYCSRTRQLTQPVRRIVLLIAQLKERMIDAALRRRSLVGVILEERLRSFVVGLALRRAGRREH